MIHEVRRLLVDDKAVSPGAQPYRLLVNAISSCNILYSRISLTPLPTTPLPR